MVKNWWTYDKIWNLIECSPKISLKKGQSYDFIEMASVNEWCYKFPNKIETKEYKWWVKFEWWDTIFARITPCLQNWKITKIPDWIMWFWSTEYFVFRGKEWITDNDYVFYLMINENVRDEAEQSMVWASWRQRANIKVIENFDIPLPPLPTQKRIASILSSYDDLIENNTRRIQLLEQQAQALYRQWFVEFKFPWYEDVEMIKSSTGFWEVPNEWKVKEIWDIYKTTSWWTPSTKRKEYYWWGIERIKTKELNWKFIINSEVKITELWLTKSSAKLVPSNSTIIAMYWATIGQLWITSRESTTNQACCIFLKEEGSQFDYNYIYSFLSYAIKEIIWLWMWAAQQNISQTVIRKIKILDPGKQLLKEFNQIHQPLFEKILMLQKQNINLKKQRDVLLPQLVSGDVLVD